MARTGFLSLLAALLSLGVAFGLAIVGNQPNPVWIILSGCSALCCLAACALLMRQRRQSRHLIAQALMRLPFVKAILQTVPVNTEEATMNLISQFIALKEKGHDESALLHQAMSGFDDSGLPDSFAKAVAQAREICRVERETVSALIAENAALCAAMRQLGQEPAADCQELSALIDKAGALGSRIAASAQRSLEAVDDLTDTAARSGQLAHTVAAHALAIDEDLQKVLESLQFQDITRQVVEGALAILDELGASLATLSPGVAGHPDSILNQYQKEREALRKILVDRSKTKDEKIAIRGVTT